MILDVVVLEKLGGRLLNLLQLDCGDESEPNQRETGE